MSLQIIPANPKFSKKRNSAQFLRYLNVSEFFCDTIQGEGIHTGQPAAFLRLQGCTLNCSYCDSTSVWQHGNPYSIQELFGLMDQADLPRKLFNGQHLVVTGGSPLMQQEALIQFFEEFMHVYDFTPFVEIENECVITPWSTLIPYIYTWNNSPKLSTSEVKKEKRYIPALIKEMEGIPNSWFKFVITCEEDWKEIEEDFLKPKLISRKQIILMPEGITRQDLKQNRDMVVNMAIRENVRYTSREHIVIWDKAIGV